MPARIDQFAKKIKMLILIPIEHVLETLKFKIFRNILYDKEIRIYT